MVRSTARREARAMAGEEENGALLHAEEEEDKYDKGSGLQGDYAAIALLLLLYTLQVPNAAHCSLHCLRAWHA